MISNLRFLTIIRIILYSFSIRNFAKWQIFMRVSEELLAPTFKVTVEVTGSSETSIHIYRATQCHISEDYHLSLENDLNRYLHF